MEPSILVVDDDDLVRSAFDMCLIEQGENVESVASTGEALKRIRENPLGYAIIFLDHNFGNGLETGDKVCREIKSINPSIMVVLMSGSRFEDNYASWIKSGADHIVQKPVESFQIQTLVEQGYSQFKSNFGSANDRREKLKDTEGADALRKVGLVGNSEELGRVALDAVLFAKMPYDVLLMGETGTGKEVIANAIHRLSDRATKPFLPINCSSFTTSENLLESELFGHEDGSFTGSKGLKRGVFELAQGGTVFLDEVHTLSKTAQQKLLRALQERKIRRVGNSNEIPVKFRLIAAGKLDLKLVEKQETGPLIADLYYRIRELVLEIPALRDRTRDVEPLVRHFKAKYEHDLKRTVEFSDAVYRALETYTWPGNVRDVASVTKSLVVRAKGSVVKINDLPEVFRAIEAEGLYHNGNLKSFPLLLAEQDRAQAALVLHALKVSGFNVSRAALLLHIPRTTLRDLMLKFKISSDEKPAVVNN